MTKEIFFPAKFCVDNVKLCVVNHGIQFLRSGKYVSEAATVDVL